MTSCIDKGISLDDVRRFIGASWTLGNSFGYFWNYLDSTMINLRIKAKVNYDSSRLWNYEVNCNKQEEIVCYKQEEKEKNES